MFESKIEMWPGGLTTLSGGTRVAVRFNRPWQKEIVVDPSTCPFCRNEHVTLRRFVEADEEWQLVHNTSTPFGFHQLIIPTASWPVEQLRFLGGEKRLATVFNLARTAVLDSRPGEYTQMDVYVGYGAGQNVTHGHFHFHSIGLLNPEEMIIGSPPVYSPPPALDETSREIQLAVHGHEERKVAATEDVTIAAGGFRGGQCLIAPNQDELELTPVVAAGLARLFSWLINLAAEKFKSLQGMPPDYQLSLVFKGTSLQHGMFVPILNNWGATENYGLLRFGSLVLPWPHQATAMHLRGEQVLQLRHPGM